MHLTGLKKKKKKIFYLNQTTLNATKCLDEERANVFVFVKAAPIKITQPSSSIVMPPGKVENSKRSRHDFARLKVLPLSLQDTAFNW